MPWFKVDDKLHSHKKAVRAGEAMALWVVAGSWSADQLTDGFVPDYIVARLMPGGLDMADRLVACDLWAPDQVDGDDGWRFNDWGDYQPTRDDVESKRAAARQRMRRVRAKRDTRSSDVPDNTSDVRANTDDVRPNLTERSPYPDPTRPDPKPPCDADATQAQVEAELVAVFHNGQRPPDGTRAAWQLSEAARQIARWDPDPGEVARRSRCWPDTWGTQTAMGLAKWWDTCRPSPSPSDEPYVPPPELPAAAPIPDEVRSRWGRRREATA